MDGVVAQIKKDIKARKQGAISKLPLNRDYAEKFKLPKHKIKLLISKGLTGEEKEYRLSEIRSQTGQKSKGNLNFLKNLTKEGRQFNNLKAFISEDLFKNYRELEGFKVVKLEKEFKENGGYIKILQMGEILKLKIGQKILKDLDNLRFRSMTNFKYPDFVCEKDDKIIFTEIKSISKFNPKSFDQKRSLVALQKKGYGAEVWNILIDGRNKVTSLEKHIIN